MTFEFGRKHSCFIDSSLPSLSSLSQKVWDRIQIKYGCCGVDNPFDYNSTAWQRALTSQSFEFAYCVVPLSCRVTAPLPQQILPPLLSSSTAFHSPSSSAYTNHTEHTEHTDRRRRHHPTTHPHHRHHRHHSHSKDQSSGQRHRRDKHSSNNSNSSVDETRVCESTFDPRIINAYGCHESILTWFQTASDILSVLGFCVMTFLKVCFTCILRYEIREMIQKIQLLKDNTTVSHPGHSSTTTAAATTAPNPNATAVHQPPPPHSSAHHQSASDSTRDETTKNDKKT